MADKPQQGNNFRADGSRYDQTTYLGRVRGFLDLIDPRTLLTSDEELKKAQNLLDRYNRGEIPKDGSVVSDDELWDALKVKQAIVHPTTNEKIFAPLRMSSFIIMNVPLVAGMLSASSLPSTVFWQFLNQTYNSALNYANRSGASVDTTEIAKSYGIAVATSLAISIGFTVLRTRGPPIIQKVTRIPFVVPYASVAGAGGANVYFTRRQEILNGVPVFDEDGNELGISQEAGKQGVYKTILSRNLGLPIPVLILPPIMMKVVPEAAPPRTKMMAELVIITMCLAGALPLGIAMYPQKLALDPKTLETQFQNLKNGKTGEPISVVYSNKGL